MLIAVVRSGSRPQKKQKKFRPDAPKVAFVAILVVALLAISSNSPLKDLKPFVPPSPSAAVEGDVITITASSGRSSAGVTGSATGPAPYDPGAAHVLYWLLLAAALIPLELEWRKKQ